MAIKRNRLESAENTLEPRVMLSGVAPGAEAQPAQTEAPQGAPESEGVVADQDGQRVNVARDESIVADVTAVEVVADDVRVNNAGLIAGGLNGVDFDADTQGGTLNNLGVISSDSRAVQIDGDDVTINNNGLIVGTDDQRNGTVYSNRTADNFTINNNGLIDAGEGNLGAGVSTELVAEGTNFTLNNNGAIQGRGNAPAGAATAGDGVRLERTRVAGALDGTTTGVFEGTINNNGLIDSEGRNGTVAGFRTVNGVSFQGTLNNNGTISGDQNGVYFGNATPAGGGENTGTVNNNGTISSDSRALNIDGRGLTVNNNGSILGTGDQRNGTVYADSTAQEFTLNNNGLIDAGKGNDGAGFSAELSAEGNDFDIVNNGTLQGRGNAAAGATTAGDGIRLERERVGGALDGTTTGLFEGRIVNNGLIDSEGQNGTVAGFRTVNGVSFQGELVNNGTISGDQNGVYFGNATPAGGGENTGVVQNNGTISSNSRALNIDGRGLTVNNNGSILGTGDQRNGTVYADSTAQEFTLNNNGLIDAGKGNDGAGFSAELSAEGNDFTINNSGLIQGRGNAAAGATTAGDGIRLERERVGGLLDGSTTGRFVGVVNNSGTIASEGQNGTVAGFRTVNGVDFQGELNNSGTISGIQNGVYFGTGENTGVVNNTGTISSDSRAVNIDGNGLTLNNEGSILATGRQRNGTVYADATADNFTINNSGSIDARGGAGSGVSLQVGSEVGDVQTASVVNSGEIFGAGLEEADAGVRLFNSVDGQTAFRGDIVNSGLISSENDTAVLVEEGVKFNGDFINSGRVDGGIDLATGDVVLTSKSSVTLDIGGVYDVEQIDADNGDVQFGGELIVNFNDGFVPKAGQTFDLIDFNTQSGKFSSVRSDQVRFDTSRLAIDGTVTVLGPQVKSFEQVAGRFDSPRRARVANRVERVLQQRQQRRARFSQRLNERRVERSSRRQQLFSQVSQRFARRGLRNLFASSRK